MRGVKVSEPTSNAFAEVQRVATADYDARVVHARPAYNTDAANWGQRDLILPPHRRLVAKHGAKEGASAEPNGALQGTEVLDDERPSIGIAQNVVWIPIE